MTTEKKIPLPEAPASVNFKAFTAKGYDMMFTLRDTDELVLLERLTKFFSVIEENYHISPTRKGMDKMYVAQQEAVSQATPLPPVAGSAGHAENWCAIHGVEMTKWDKEGRSWFSHKVDDDTWCKGK